jgi:hypothetical protein
MQVHVQNVIWRNKMTGSYAMKQQGLFQSENFPEPSCGERPELSESEAITGAQRGDAEAFECIYQHWSIGNAKPQLHRARRRLRELLRESQRLEWLTPPHTSYAQTDEDEPTNTVT